MRDNKGRFIKGIIPYNKGKGKFYLLECKNCQRLFFIAIGKYQNGRRKFCNRKCKYQFEKPTKFILREQRIKNLGKYIEKGHIPWNKEKEFYQIKGERNHFWRGGITDKTRKRVSELSWKIIRKKVYKRDNWNCQECGKKCHNDIQCHHIIPYYISQDNSLKNLITLCKSCHGKQELKYRRRNKLGQLQEA